MAQCPHRALEREEEGQSERRCDGRGPGTGEAEKDEGRVRGSLRRKEPGPTLSLA